MAPDDLSHGGIITADRVEGDYYFHQLGPASGQSLAVVCCGREQCLRDYRIERADFPYLALEYVVSGEGWLRLGASEWPLAAGALFIYGPGLPHRFEARGEGLVKYFVDFAGDRAEAMLREQGLAPGDLRVLASRRWTCDIFDQLIACAELPREKATLLSASLLEVLLLRVGEDVQPVANVSSISRRTYSRCREYLREHHAQLSKIEDAASACGVSLAYFVRLFQQHSRESAYNFLVRLKMDHAADLLVKQSLSVKSTAARVGYSDPYHFSRVFKRYHGIAPKLFREEFHRLPQRRQPPAVD